MVLPIVFGILVGLTSAFGFRSSYTLFTSITLAIIFVVAIIISSWAQISLISALKDPAEHTSIAQAYKRGWEKIFSYWWISILLTLVLMGSYILALIPGIIFTVWFVFAPFALVVDDKRGMDAIFHSKSLVRGRWWGVFGRLILIGLATMLAYFVISFVLGFILGFFGTAGILIGIFSNAIINLVVMTYAITAASVLYQSLKASAVTPAPVEKRGVFIGFAIFGAIIVPILTLAAIALAAWFSQSESSQTDYGYVPYETYEEIPYTEESY